VALFKRTPERVLRFFYEERMVPEVGDICAQMAKRRPDRLVDAEELTKIAGTPLRGGVVAEPRLCRPSDLRKPNDGRLHISPCSCWTASAIPTI
jgi:TrmH RNA methyltransferase